MARGPAAGAQPVDDDGDAAPIYAPRAAARLVPPVPVVLPRWVERGVDGACVVGIAFLLLQILTFGYGRDQGIYAMVGKSLLHGGMPYRDAWDFKPPGIFVVFAFARALFGGAQIGVRLVEVAGLVAMAVVMVRLARRWWGAPRAGLIAATLAILVHAQLDFWHTAQPESFGGMLTMAALLLAARADAAPSEDRAAQRRAMLVWAGSGALFGLAGMLKPPLAGGAVVVALVPALSGLRAARAAGAPPARAFAELARPFVAHAVGGAMPVALCAVWFAARGALRDLVDVLFVFTPHYTKLGWEGSSVGGMLYWGFTEWLTTYNSLVTVGLLLLLPLRLEPRERWGVWLLGGIIAIHIVGVTMQGKFFPYHYGATWPLTAMLAGLGLHKLLERLVARTGAAVGAAVFAVVVLASNLGRSATKDVRDSFLDRCRQRIELFTSGARDQAAIDELASVADVSAGANRAVAQLLRARTEPGRRVFVWGFEPVIYDLADRDPATRFLYDVPQRVAWAKDAMREQLMADLARTPPAAIVVEHRDVFPMVTGDVLDSADTLRGFPALAALLDDRYELAAAVEDFDVYLER